MATTPTSDRLVAVFRDTILALVRRNGPDLSARQLSIFLISYLEDDNHTVRGLAADLDVAKPAITRALNRLTELGLAARKPDPADRRSVLVQRTPKGAALFRDLRGVLAAAEARSHKSGG